MPINNQVAAFFSKFPLETESRGKQLILIGDQIEEVIFIEKGRIDQYDIAKAGNKIIVNTFGPGAYLPMSNVLNNLESAYFFEAASSEIIIRRAPAAEVVAFLHQNPLVTVDLLRRVYRGVDGMLAKLSTQMSGTAGEQVWRQLVIHAQRFGEDIEKDGCKKIKMTESQLAQSAGLARETVSRELKKLRSKGLIEQPRQGQMIIKIEKPDK